MHSSRMRTIRSSSRLSRGGGLPQCMLGYQPPPPPDQAPTPRADTPPDQTPPGPDTPLGADTPPEQTPPRDQSPHPVDRHTPVKT